MGKALGPIVSLCYLPRDNTGAMLPLVLREQVNPKLLERAAELRKHVTPEERLVWQELRANRLGVHFRRQQALAPYIVVDPAKPIRQQNHIP